VKRTVLLVLVAIIAASASSGGRPSRADACAFAVAPTAYEGPKDRSLDLAAMNLAAFNLIDPGDPYFGLPRLAKGPRQVRVSVEPVVPPILLKSIGWIESSIDQTRNSPFGGIGPALISSDCGHGIMQVTSGMTVPLGTGGAVTPEQLLVATHYAYNIDRGAVMLADKWNDAPASRPIAGTDTDGDPSIVENWYFAVWSYNGFTGPGANRSNHPLDPIYAPWPRTPYSCGPSNDGFGHDRSKYPYQELVWGCASHPPVVDGKQLWQPFALSLPDLTNAKWSGPLQLANWLAPYVNMDIPSPSPSHKDPTQSPLASAAAAILGAPELDVQASDISLSPNDKKTLTSEDVDLGNDGTGILVWGAVSSASWLTLSPAAGVALGPDVTCTAGASCVRDGTLTLTVNPAQIPKGGGKATVTISSPQSSETSVLNVTVNGGGSSPGKTGIPGVTRN
jgi:hypothetical protein